VTLPESSNLMFVARLRYIQSVHERPEWRNPDRLVRRFIPFFERYRLAWVRQEKVAQLRKNPFYYYLVARTKHYDQVLSEAVADGVQSVVNVGCGTDTRAHRFSHLFQHRGVRVLECDRPEAIRAKQRIVRRWRDAPHVDYLPLDLNAGTWPDLAHWLGKQTGRTLVLMEGVSPYIEATSFGKFLSQLASTITAGSEVAYDFKILGIQDDFGREGQTQKPFRLPTASGDIAAFHEAHGLQLERLELSCELCARLLPGIEKSAVSSFTQDALIRLRTLMSLLILTASM
jgi:methyltransferase (TIGR00027 family)